MQLLAATVHSGHACCKTEKAPAPLSKSGDCKIRCETASAGVVVPPQDLAPLFAFRGETSFDLALALGRSQVISQPEAGPLRSLSPLYLQHVSLLV
jgi:hypothetical protein